MAKWLKDTHAVGRRLGACVYIPGQPQFPGRVVAEDTVSVTVRFLNGDTRDIPINELNCLDALIEDHRNKLEKHNARRNKLCGLYPVPLISLVKEQQ